MTSPTLAVLSGNTVTTWECMNEEKDPSTFSPQPNLPLADIAWNHNGQVIATCSAVSTDIQLHNNIVLTAAHSGNQLDSLQHNVQWQRPPGAATSLAFGGKSRYLCVGDKTGAVCLWDLKKKTRVRQFFHQGQPCLQVAIDPTDTYVLSLTAPTIHSYKLREGVPAMDWTPQQNYIHTKLSISTIQPNILAVGTDDGSAMLYDIGSSQKSTPFFQINRRHDAPISGIAFSHTNDKLLATSSEDGLVQFFDTKSGSVIEQMEKVQNGITDLALYADGISCAVGNSQGEVILYDLRQAHQPLASMYVQGSVTAMQFSPPPKHMPVIHRSTPRKDQTVPPQQSSPRDLQREESSNVFAPPGQQSRLFTQPSNSSEDGQYFGVNEEKPTRGSPQKSLAQNTVSTLGGIGSLQSISPRPTTSFSSPGKPSAPSGNYQAPGQTVNDQNQYNSKAAEAQFAGIDQVRDVVRDEIEKLQDDLEETLRNLHMDMIRQFHQQSQELNNALSSQMAAMDQLRDENQRLREENAFLKRQQQQPPQTFSTRNHSSHHPNDVLFGN
eukprot:Nitzschia sp. Nitz4//scaffold3_size479765//65443//67234//NITZ4_000024-RA/size479765-augustus-gene-0.22-mRNA-1//-1//CDS//3329550530//7950//frame0